MIPKSEISPVVKKVKRGEIYFAQITSEHLVGSEQTGIRPVLVLQNDIGNRYSPTTIVAFITSSNKKMDLPIHAPLPKHISGLSQDSIVLLEQIRTIDKRRLLKRVSLLSPEFMEIINEKILISLGIHPNYK